MSTPAASAQPIVTDIPARLDRLPWGRFHWLFITALGVTWLLDGLEVMLVGSIGNALLDPRTLGLDEGQLGRTSSGYLAGQVVGALIFGPLTDKLGRKKLFTITLLVYLAGAVLTACAWNFWTFALARALTGMGIGGEYAAITSAIDELIPARLRGRVDLTVNATFWVGAIASAGLTVVVLDPRVVPIERGWRLAFGLGAGLSLVMIVARYFVPESPRWLLTHGRQAEAERITADIEATAGGPAALPPAAGKITLHPGEVGLGDVARALLGRYRGRAFLGLVLIATQAFFNSGPSFTFPLVLHKYLGVDPARVPLFQVAIYVASFLGPVLLGPLFDTVGRRKMIAGTYLLSGVLVAGVGWLFHQDLLSAAGMTALWAVTFFVATAASTGGYLTISEVFPLEMRALAIAVFFALGALVGGIPAPWLFGELLKAGSRDYIFYGYLGGAALMGLAAAVEWRFGVDAEGKSLEDVAAPLGSAEARAAAGPGHAPFLCRSRARSAILLIRAGYGSPAALAAVANSLAASR